MVELVISCLQFLVHNQMDHPVVQGFRTKGAHIPAKENFEGKLRADDNLTVVASDLRLLLGTQLLLKTRDRRNPQLEEM